MPIGVHFYCISNQIPIIINNYLNDSGVKKLEKKNTKCISIKYKFIFLIAYFIEHCYF